MADPPPFVVLKAAGAIVVSCRRCAYPLGIMSSDGLAIVVDGVTSTHRTTLTCNHCRKERTWTPQDERPRRGTQ